MRGVAFTAAIRTREVTNAIYHLAAFANPQGSFRHAERTLSTNVLGARSVLEAARATANLLDPGDLIGVIAFDSQPTWLVRLQKAA